MGRNPLSNISLLTSKLDVSFAASGLTSLISSSNVLTFIFSSSKDEGEEDDSEEAVIDGGFSKLPDTGKNSKPLLLLTLKMEGFGACNSSMSRS